MLAVYDLTCNGLRDARGVSEPLVLSWRLGSDRMGAEQSTCRLVVTSMKDGSCKWDTGTVYSSANKLVYDGEALDEGETCVWFVSVTDDGGQSADGAPSSFVYGSRPQGPTSAEGPQRLGMIWTSDEALDEALDAVACAGDLDHPMWRGLVGLSWADGEHERILFQPRVESGRAGLLDFAQGSLLLSRGLLVARWERRPSDVVLELLLPPGVAGVVDVGTKTHEVASGRHAYRMAAAGDTIPEER